MSQEMVFKQNLEPISTGKEDVDRVLGGGIPPRTLMLLEGPSASGKSTLAQQFLWGALTAGERAALFTTEQTVQSFLRQMDSLGEDVMSYYLLGHLKIFPIAALVEETDPAELFQELTRRIAAQRGTRVVVLDSLSTFVSSAGGEQIQQFFNSCKSLCDDGKVIICTVHSGAFPEDTLTRVRSVCDAHLRLSVEKSGTHLLKTIEVAKIRGADMSTGNISAFDVEPGLGIRIIPISRAQA